MKVFTSFIKIFLVNSWIINITHSWIIDIITNLYYPRHLQLNLGDIGLFLNIILILELRFLSIGYHDAMQRICVEHFVSGTAFCRCAEFLSADKISVFSVSNFCPEHSVLSSLVIQVTRDFLL